MGAGLFKHKQSIERGKNKGLDTASEVPTDDSDIGAAAARSKAKPISPSNLTTRGKALQ